MALLIVSTVVFVFIALGFQISIALWVYEDSKVKSTQPPLLWLVFILFGNIIGLIIYLVVGRSIKDVKPPGKYKGLLIGFIFAFIISTVVFIAGIFHFVKTESGGFISTTNGIFTSSSNRVKDDEWKFTARSANGWVQRSIEFTPQQLSNLSVNSYSSEGVVTLRLEQEGAVSIIDISGSHNEQIETLYFSPDRKIKIRITFDRARDVDLSISWR